MILEGKINWQEIRDPYGYPEVKPGWVLFKVYQSGDCADTSQYALLLGRVIWEGQHAGQVAIRSSLSSYGGVYLSGGNWGRCLPSDEVFYGDIDWQTGTFKVAVPSTICGLSGPARGVVDPIEGTAAGCALSCQSVDGFSSQVYDDNFVVIHDIRPALSGNAYRFYSFFKIGSNGSLKFSTRIRSSYYYPSTGSPGFSGYYGGNFWIIGGIPGQPYCYTVERWNCTGASPVKDINQFINGSLIMRYNTGHRLTGLYAPYNINGQWWGKAQIQMSSGGIRTDGFIRWNPDLTIPLILTDENFIGISSISWLGQFMGPQHTGSDKYQRRHIAPAQPNKYSVLWEVQETQYDPTIEPYGPFSAIMRGNYWVYLYYDSNRHLNIVCRRWSDGSEVVRTDLTAIGADTYSLGKDVGVLPDGSILVRDDSGEIPFVRILHSGQVTYPTREEIGFPPAVSSGGIEINQRDDQYSQRYIITPSYFCNNVEIQFVEILKLYSSCALKTVPCSGGTMKGADVTITGESAQPLEGAVIRYRWTIESETGESTAVTDEYGKADCLCPCRSGLYSVLIELLDVYYEGYEWDQGPCRERTVT